MTSNLTRLTDSGFILESGGIAVAFDVGEFCDAELLASQRLSAAVFSHMHSDHCDISKLPTTAITVAGPSDIREKLVAAGVEDYLALAPGAALDVQGFTVEAVVVNHGNISTPIENYGLVITTPAGERIWFTGDIRVHSTSRPEGRFDLIIVPVGGQYVFDASEAFAYLLEFPGEFVALGVHYDYAPEQAIIFTKMMSRRIKPVVLAPGAELLVGGS